MVPVSANPIDSNNSNDNSSDSATTKNDNSKLSAKPVGIVVNLSLYSHTPVHCIYEL